MKLCHYIIVSKYPYFDKLANPKNLFDDLNKTFLNLDIKYNGKYARMAPNNIVPI